MSRVVLATTSAAFEDSLRQALGGALAADARRWRDGILRDVEQAVDEIADDDTGVVLVGPELPVDSALELVRALDRLRPDVSAVLVTTPSPSVWQEAMRAGARDVVAPDAAPADLRAALDQALETAQRRRAVLGPAEAESHRANRVIAVVSPKGGAGKTTLAANLSVGLARHAPGEVALVDLDLQFGDVANALRLAPEHTFADTLPAAAVLDATYVKACLTHHTSGLYALCAPDSPAVADDVSEDHTALVLKLLASQFPYVVIDTAAGIDEQTLTAMEAATDLLLVCATDVASIRSMRKELEALDVIGLTTQRRHLVLNRSDARVGLDVRDIEGTLGIPVDATVPSTRAVPLSMNQGIPLIESDPRSTASRAFGELVNRFAPAPVPASHGSGRGWLRREGR